MTFFLEPGTADLTWSNELESTSDWLNRSTRPLAKNMRRSLNEHIACIPEKYQKTIVDGLKNRWHDTIFELMIARIMQEIGGVIEIENTTSSGKRPDIWVYFNDGSIIIEATTTYANKEAGKIESERAPLLRIIEQYAPKGWWVDVVILPEIGHNDSKKEFKLVIHSDLNIDPPTSEYEKPIYINREISSGTIKLKLYPASKKAHGLGIRPAIIVFDDSSIVIPKAIKNKKNKRQLKGVSNPAFIAINLNSISGSFEEFDKVLFGYTFEQLDYNWNTIESGFQPNGLFLKNNSKKPPTIAGIIAFRNVSIMNIEGPILYKHPRFNGTLPSAFELFEQRSYDLDSNVIKVKPGQLESTIRKLKLVKL